jgi:hypothetical protein
LNETLRDIQGPLSLHSRAGLYLLLGILLAVAAWYLGQYFLSRRKKFQAALPVKRAHEIAYERLEALRRKELIQQGKTKEYYSEISDIIRRYIEDRFSLKAPEMTTEEFLYYAAGASAAELAAHKARLKEFLVACDLVKFAKHEPSADEMRSIFDAAKNFVDQTQEAAPSS